MKLDQSSPTLVVAGGGTGGHVLAGIAIADAWRDKYPRSRVLFVGAKGGIEERLVPRAQYPLETLNLGSLKRVSLQKRTKTLLQLPIAFVRSLSIVVRERPAAVIGVGGYASGPFVLIARLLSRKFNTRVAILEQNAVPGLTNKILSYFANFVLCAFSGIERQFYGKKVYITGNPIRAEIRPMDPAPRNPFTIFIFGGSQGSQGINTLVLDALSELSDLKPKLRFIHQTGELDYARVLEGHKRSGSQARVEKFIYDMPSAYREASLIICRSGSSTLAEIAAVQRASILIPFPYAADDHQEKNAQLFVDAGAADKLRQFQSTGSDLARIIRSLVAESRTLERMERQVAQFYRPRAARDAVDLLSQHIVMP